MAEEAAIRLDRSLMRLLCGGDFRNLFVRWVLF